MANRADLDRELRTLLGSNNVYFQPPESTKLKFDCFVYRLSGANVVSADNDIYLYNREYALTFITKNPDNPLIDEIPKYFAKKLKICRLNSYFTSDNLNHYNYTISY